MAKEIRTLDAMPVPTEDEEQIQLFTWARHMRGRWPEIDLMYHIPNGGKRGKVEAARFKMMGVKPGVSDVCLPVPRGGYHGLYIEMKRRRGGRVSKDQADWIDAVIHQGYVAVVCRGWIEAAKQIEKYMKLGVMRRDDVDTGSSAGGADPDSADAGQDRKEGV